MATFTIALSIFFLLGEGNASIQDHCTDISYWDEIKYETTTKQCCDTKLEQVCTNKSEQICQDVLELECEVVAWGECQSTPTNTLGTKCNVKINEFAHQNCEEVTASVAHTKKVPQCKQITKNNCVTDWQVDENGNKVWAGTETCTPVTWEECDIVEKTVEFPTVKTHCDVDSHIKWAEFVDDTTNIIGLESKCEVKKAVNCKNIVVNKCAPVVWEECKMVPREECFAKVVHTPSQEKIHQKKCLTGDNTAHLDQIPPRNQLLQSHDFTSDLASSRIEDDAKNNIRANGGLKETIETIGDDFEKIGTQLDGRDANGNLLDGRVAAGNVFGNRVESTQDCNTEGCHCPEIDVDYYGNDISSISTSNWQTCARECSNEGRCSHWSWTTPEFRDDWYRRICHLKTSGSGRKHERGVLSGTSNCQVSGYYLIESSGGAAQHQPSKMGPYTHTGETEGYPVFENDGQYLFVASDGWWTVGPNVSSIEGSLYHPDRHPTPSTPPLKGWKYYNNGWQDDATLTVTHISGDKPQPAPACSTTCEKDKICVEDKCLDEYCVEDKCLRKCPVTDLESLETGGKFSIIDADCYCAANGGGLCPKQFEDKKGCQGGNICERNYGCMRNVCPFIPESFIPDTLWPAILG